MLVLSPNSFSSDLCSQPHVTLAKTKHMLNVTPSIDAGRFLERFQKVSVGKFVPERLELLRLGKTSSGYWPIVDYEDL